MIDRAITSKLEIDVMQQSELGPAVDLATKFGLPALVVHQQLVNDAVLVKLSRRGRYKIYTPVDWPKGDNYGTLKMRGMTINALSIDGFEIMLTGGKNEAEVYNEARALTEFVVDLVNPQADIRFVLGAHMRPEEDVATMCRALARVRTPAMVRTDHHLKVQATKGSPEAHASMIEQIRRNLGAPVKLSGNFVTARSVASCPAAARFAVSLPQAQSVIRDMDRQPDGLRQMLVGQSEPEK